MRNNTAMVGLVQNVDHLIEIGTKVYTIGTDVEMERGKELFNCCKYKDAEQIFSRVKGSDATAWKILCCIMTGDIGRRGGRIVTLLQESIKNQDASISDITTLLKTLIDTYGGAIDRKTKHKAMTSLYEASDGIAREQMKIMISDVSKKALDIVKKRGYTPFIYDDRAIPLRILNNKLGKYKYRVRHYKSDDITHVLKTINADSFLQEVVSEYISMTQCNIIDIYKDRLDTRNQDVLKYIRSLYMSNIAYERELRFIRVLDKQHFIDIIDRLDEKGWPRVKMSCTECTKYFNMANDEEKAICRTEIERVSTASVVTLLEYDDTIEKRGYLMHDDTVNQISKEDLAIGDTINRYTHEYVAPMQGVIYCDN